MLPMEHTTKQCAVALGQAVRRARKAKNLSQEAFADACELDRSYIGQVERGEKNLSLESVLRIAKGLGLRPPEFFALAKY